MLLLYFLEEKGESPYFAAQSYNDHRPQYVSDCVSRHVTSFRIGAIRRDGYYYTGVAGRMQAVGVDGQAERVRERALEKRLELAIERMRCL